jgi:hypothetical protein
VIAFLAPFDQLEEGATMSQTGATHDAEITQRTIRVGMLAVIAALCVASIADWIHHDLSTLFVLVIALIGIGTRGGVLDSIFVVGIEATAVAVLAVATFSGSNAFLHAASGVLAVIAIGKIAALQFVPPAAPTPAAVAAPPPAADTAKEAAD